MRESLLPPVGDETTDEYNPHTTTDINNQIDPTSCCYNRCSSRKYCRNTITCGYINSKRDSTLCCLVSGALICMFAAIIVPIVLNVLLDLEINEQVVIDGTDAPNYAAWQSNIPQSPGDAPPLSINYKLYYFDTQNPQEVTQGAKPIVVQKGPYAFHEWYNKFDVKFTDNGDTVMYRNQKYYTFNPDGTAPGLSLDDKLTLPYPTFIAFAYLFNELNETTYVKGHFTAEQLLYHYIEAKIDKLIAQVEVQKEECSLQVVRSCDPDEYDPIIEELQVIKDRTWEYLKDSPPAATLLKSLMCNNDAKHASEVSFNVTLGVSPFFEVDPVQGYFGWTADPVLYEANDILQQVEESQGLGNSLTSTWRVDVPGVAINSTSTAMATKFYGPMVQKTGKKNPKQIAQYVLYSNMSTQYICVSPLGSGNVTGQVPSYDKGVDYAACPRFQYEWNQTYAEFQGYTLAFATDYANRIGGCDGQQFGRPLRSEKIQAYVNDIYRTVYIYHDSDQDWHGVSLRRYKIQEKDLQNATMNPQSAQYYQFGPSGMENVTQAAGMPTWVSKPHFFDGETELAAAIEGLSPNQISHDSYLDIEPMTGLFARAAKRLQLNYVLNDWYAANISTTTASDLNSSVCSTPLITDENYIRNCQLLMQFFECLAIPTDFKVQEGNIYYPYVWAEESFELSADDASTLKDSIYVLVDASEEIGMWCLVASGFFVSSIILLIVMQRRPIEKVFAPRPSADLKFHHYMDENKLEDTMQVHNALFGGDGDNGDNDSDIFWNE